MDAVIPWTRVLKLIEPHDPKGGSGRPLMSLPVMLRVYFMQQWFNLSDPQAQDGLYDSKAMRRFAGLDLGMTRYPTRARFSNSGICWSSTA